MFVDNFVNIFCNHLQFFDKILTIIYNFTIRGGLPMTILEQIKACHDQFSASELKVYDVVINTPEYIEFETISRIAERANTSSSAVLRFCHTLGFTGYKEFRYALANELRQAQTADPSSLYLSAVDQLVKNMRQIKKEDLIDLAAIMKKAPHIYLIGFYYSSLPVLKLKRMLEDLGCACHYATDYMDTLHLLNTIRNDDLLIIFSKSGLLTYYDTIIKSLPSHLHNTYLITETKNSPMSKKINHCIILPSLNINEHYDMSISMSIFVSMLMEVYNQ